ncbi:hypothetical protein [Haloferula sp. A504]|uniref:bestrophin-like domain n=1 Tax=Haloferula sp. A504 TaxID=3373601 RepID=UPI0031CB4A57|nr:hypothetical protein [Verrucomicrobiaceae bacterium E54]
MLIVLLSVIIELGFRAGRWLSGRAGEKGLSKHPMEAAVTTALLGLMAFMLGFSFSMATKRYSERRALILEDHNTAGTLMLRADLLPAGERATAKSLIEEYVRIRKEVVDRRSLEGIEEVITRCEAIQGQLWEQAVTLRRETGDTALNLYLATLNDLIDTDAKRRAVAFSNRFPNALWGTLFFLLTIATVMLGINSGLHGRRSRLASSALIVAFSLVVVLIIDLDRPVTELVQQRRSLMPSDN